MYQQKIKDLEDQLIGLARQRISDVEWLKDKNLLAISDKIFLEDEVDKLNLIIHQKNDTWTLDKTCEGLKERVESLRKEVNRLLILNGNKDRENEQLKEEMKNIKKYEEFLETEEGKNEEK